MFVFLFFYFRLFSFILKGLRELKYRICKYLFVENHSDWNVSPENLSNMFWHFWSFELMPKKWNEKNDRLFCFYSKANSFLYPCLRCKSLTFWKSVQSEKCTETSDGLKIAKGSNENKEIELLRKKRTNSNTKLSSDQNISISSC